MKHFVLIILLIVPLFIFSQNTLKKGEIRGAVTDSTGKEKFSQATVVLLSHKDSSVVAVTTSDEKGQFFVSGIANGKYRLYITSVQFFPYSADFEIGEQSPSRDFATIRVRKGKVEEMATVVADAPIIVKQDTVEYRADAFKTRPNAVVEDLLKKLPGVQVDKNGTITAHGQTVTRVLVDGKPFFGNDPKTATKNLPANIVDKVQVLDKKSDQSQFTGFDDGTTEKVINITIKKDKRKGFFGRALAGAGTNSRYESNLSLNRFNNGLQLSFIGQANNINNEGFTFQDMMDFSGGFGGMGKAMADGGGGSGGGMAITINRGGGGGMNFGGMNFGGPATGLKATQAGGINYSNAWSKRINVSGSYFYNNSYGLNETFSSRQNFPVDTAFHNITNQSTISRTWRTNHRFNLDFDWNIDSFNSLLIRPAITFVQSRSQSETNSDISSFSKTPRSANLQKTNSFSEQPNFSGTLLWRHKTRVKGRTFSVRMNGGTNHTDGHGDNYNRQQVFSPILFSQVTDQVNFTDNSSNTFNTRISYTEPLSKTRLLELYYSYGRNYSKSDKKTLRRDGAGIYSILDSLFTNDFSNIYANHQAGFNVQTKMKKYDYTLGMSVQKADLTSENVIKSSTIKQSNVYNFFPVARMNFTVAKNKKLSLNYRGNTNQPTASQLQPVADNSNPLSIRLGNPALKQEFANNINLSYNKFDMVKMKSFFTFLNFSTTANKITDSVVNLAAGIQSRKPVNVNGNWNAMGSFSFGIPLRKFKTTNINTSTMVMLNRSANLTDGLKNYTRLFTLTQNLGVNYNYKDKLDVMISGMATYSNTNYTLNNIPTNEYYTYNGSADVSYTFLKQSFTIQSDLDYNSYRGRSDGYNTEFILWNASVSKLFLKDKSLEARFTAFDMLKQNKAINRTTQDTYIEDSRSNVLTQYFMVTLKYSLNKFGGKGARSFTMPKVPGSRGINNIRIGM